MIFDHSESVEEELMFVPGEIFRDESLSGPEEVDASLDAWVASVESLPQTLPEFVLALQRYTKTNQWERIEQLWDACFKDSSASPFSPDFRAYGLLMRSFAERTGKSERAEAELKNMIATDVLPTGQVYANLMLANWRDSHSSRVMEILEEVKYKKLSWASKDLRTIMQALHGTSLDALEFISVLTPFIHPSSSPKRDETSKSSRPHHHAAEESVEMEMYGYALSKSLSVLDMDSANIYAHKILNSKATLFTRTIAHLANWYIAKGQLTEARNFINHAILKDRAPLAAGLTHSKLMPPRLSILLLELAIRSSENKKEGAQAALPQFYALFGTYTPRDALALGIFMTRVLFQNRLFQEMFEVADHIEKSLGSAAALTRIFNLRMRAHIYLQEPEKALEILARMQKDHIHQPNVHTSTVLIKLTAQLHSPYEARELLHSIISSIGTPQPSAFRAVIAAFCQNAKVDEATEIIELMSQKGLRITWNDYAPIMDVYERLNLLGKQFTLYYELLTKKLPFETPSPELTSRLIFGCIRQRFITVAVSVASSIEKHQIPLSTGLVGALVELYYQSKDTAKLQLMAEYARAKISGDGSAIEKRNFATLAIYAYSYLGRPDDALNIFKELKEAKLPLSIDIFNAVLACYIKHKQFAKAFAFFQQCEAEFGSSIAKQADLNSNSTAYRIMLTRSSEFDKVRAIWTGVVAAERSRRTASETQANAMRSSQSIEVPTESIQDDTVDVLDANTREDVTLDEVEDLSSISSSGTPPSSEPETVTHATLPIESEKIQETVKVPRLTLKLALSVLQKAHDHLDTHAEFILDIAEACQEFRLPNTLMMYTIQAQAMIHLNRVQPLLALFEKMQAAHFNMTHDFYHSVMFEATKHRWHKHKFGAAIMGYMENRHGTLSAKPNEETWQILLQCVYSKLMGSYLKAYREAGYHLNRRTLQSVARNLLRHELPIDAAINDTFVLIQYMENQADVYPCAETLTSLFNAVTRDIAHSAWSLHFHRLLLHLHQSGHLSWNSKHLKDALGILDYRMKYVWNKTTEEKKALKLDRPNLSSAHENGQNHVKRFQDGADAQNMLQQLLSLLASTGDVDQPLPALTAHKLNLSPDAQNQLQEQEEEETVNWRERVHRAKQNVYSYPSSTPSSRSHFPASRAQYESNKGRVSTFGQGSAVDPRRPTRPTL